MGRWDAFSPADLAVIGEGLLHLAEGCESRDDPWFAEAVRLAEEIPPSDAEREAAVESLNDWEG